MFDSHCLMCHQVVQFLLKHNQKQNLLFTALDSPKAIDLKINFGIDPFFKDSMIYIFEESVYMKSAGLFEICQQLDWPFKWLYYLKFATIKPFGDWIYDIISKNRYIFNRENNSCSIMLPEQEGRFI